MKVSLPGLFANVVQAIREGDKDSAGMYEFSLRELQRHLEETIRGEHTLNEFAEFYCLPSALAATKKNRNRKAAE